MPWPAPRPGRADLASDSRRGSFPIGMAGLEGPVVPRRMTGALKLILGMLAGGWKLEGKPPGRPGCWLFACMPGGGAVPGAAMLRQHTLSKPRNWSLPVPGGAPIPGGALPPGKPPKAGGRP